MTEPVAKLEYRAAADDRRQSFERWARMVPRFLLITLVIVLAYAFLVGLLGGITIMVEGLVAGDLRMVLLSGGVFAGSTVCFLLMLFCARVLSGTGAALIDQK